MEKNALVKLVQAHRYHGYQHDGGQCAGPWRNRAQRLLPGFDVTEDYAASKVHRYIENGSLSQRKQQYRYPCNVFGPKEHFKLLIFLNGWSFC